MDIGFETISLALGFYTFFCKEFVINKFSLGWHSWVWFSSLHLGIGFATILIFASVICVIVGSSSSWSTVEPSLCSTSSPGPYSASVRATSVGSSLVLFVWVSTVSTSWTPSRLVTSCWVWSTSTPSTTSVSSTSWWTSRSYSSALRPSTSALCTSLCLASWCFHNVHVIIFLLLLCIP